MHAYVGFIVDYKNDIVQNKELCKYSMKPQSAKIKLKQFIAVRVKQKQSIIFIPSFGGPNGPHIFY